MDENFDELKSALADHYELESAVGAGGMAVVYLARDLKHDRNVAIKVLRPDLSASLGAERFLREIQIAAKLSHPHILPLYDSGEAEGHLYYVMPFIEGESLRELIDRETQLGLEESVKITSEVAEALSLAHSYGVIHRDIKPENIMLTGGHAVVADFGIARAVGVSGGSDLTQAGTAIGTPAYMSPEQANGDPNLDGRTDVYSLGCVLYEMLVGQIPFTGPTAQAIIARHTMDHITAPHIMRETVSEELEDVIVCAMSKSPADRFKTAAEMSEALKALASGDPTNVRKSTMLRRPTTGEVVIEKKRSPLIPAIAGAAVVVAAVVGWQVWSSGDGRPSVDGGLDPSNIAVLYFRDMSSDGSLTHITDGLTEALIADLSRVQALDVRSRNAVEPYRGSDVPRDSVARMLEVGTLIAGRVEPVGDQLEVNAILADESGAEIARAFFELPVDQLLMVRDSVAQEVSRLLRAELGDEVRLRSRRAETSSVEAWSLVQRGEKVRKDAEELLVGDDVEGALQALLSADSLLRIAEAADPSWVEPMMVRASIANRLSRLAENRRDALEWIDSAIAHADRALAINAVEARALELRGVARYFQWYRYRPSNRDEAERLFDSARQDLRSAVQADATLASAHNVLSVIHGQEGDFTSEMLEARRAYEEDAYLQAADDILMRLFWSTYNLEQHSQALDWCDEGRRRFPDDIQFAQCQIWLLTTDAKDPDVDVAWQLASEVTERTPEPNREFASRAMGIVTAGVLARAGLADSARSVLVAQRAGPDLDPTMQLKYYEAYMRVLLGDFDEALDLLREFFVANPEEDHGGGDSGEIYWWWRDLRSHPRFGEVMRGG